MYWHRRTICEGSPFYSTCGDALAGPGEVTEWGGWPAAPQPPSSEISSFHPPPPHRRPSLFSSTTKIAQLCTVQLLLVALLKHSQCYYPVGGRHYRFYRHLWSDESDFYLTDSIKHFVLCYSKVDHVHVPDREPGGGGEKTFYKYFNLGMYLKNVFQSISFGACGYE